MESWAIALSHALHMALRVISLLSTSMQIQNLKISNCISVRSISRIKYLPDFAYSTLSPPRLCLLSSAIVCSKQCLAFEEGMKLRFVCAGSE